MDLKVNIMNNIPHLIKRYPFIFSILLCIELLAIFLTAIKPLFAPILIGVMIWAFLFLILTESIGIGCALLAVLAFFQPLDFPGKLTFRTDELLLLFILGIVVVGFLYSRSPIEGGTTERIKVYLSGVDIPILLLFTIILLSTILSFTLKYEFSILSSLISLRQWFFYLIIFYLTVNLLRTKKEIKIFVIILLISTCLLSLWGIRQFLTAGIMTQRANSFFCHSNVFGGYLSLVIPITLSIFCISNSWKKVLLSAVMFIILCSGVAVSLSRSAFVGLGVTLLFFLIIFWKELVRWISIILCIIIGALLTGNLAVVIFRALPTSWLDISTMGRLHIWDFALASIRNHPFLGVGLQHYTQVYAYDGRSALKSLEFLHAHNLYLELAMGIGLIGLGLFMWFIVIVLKRGMWVFKTGSTALSRAIALGCVGGIINFLADGLFEYLFHNVNVGFLFWMILGIIMTLWRLENNKNNEI